MRTALITVAILLAFVLAGCGGGGTQQYSLVSSASPTFKVDETHYYTGNSGIDYYLALFRMPSGKTLTCVMTAAGVPSCNWDKFNKELSHG